MEKEVSHAVEIGVTLVIMAAVIGIIFFTVFMGDSVKNDAFTFAVDTKTTVESAAIEDLYKAEQTDMPTATAYNILRRYSNSISAFYCTYCVSKGEALHDEITNLSISDNNCLARHLQGKVKLCVYRNGEGQYCVFVHDVNCEGEKIVQCTCDGYIHKAGCAGPNNCTCDDTPHAADCPCALRGMYNCDCYGE